MIPVVRVAGTPAECGAGYGAAARERIGANLEAYQRRFRDQAGLDQAAVARAGTAYRDATVAHQPRIAAMLDAVAEAAGAPVALLYALNARTELLNRTLDPECTAIGVLGTHTATGHLLLGQNWDWHPDQREATLLLDTTDERGHRILTLAEAGMLAKAGLNSAGVGQCLNLLRCDRDGVADPPGLPYHVLVRATLEADTLAGALQAACRAPRNASVNLLLGQAGEPDGGELIDLELVPGAAGWLHPVDGVLTHANHFQTGLPVHDRQADLGGSSLFRAARARRLLAQSAAVGKTTTDDLAAVLRDHTSFPHGICRHPDHRDPPWERSLTACSLLLDLAERRLGITDGPPCQQEYAWYVLD